MSHISYSQFSTWKTCPFQWKLSYIEKKRIPSVSIHLLFGSAINDTIQEYLITYYEKTEKIANELDLNDLLLNKMIEIFSKYEKESKGFTTQEELLDFYTDGVKILKWFKKKRGDYFSKRGYEFLGCEINIEYKIRKNITFIGRIDCAIRDIVLEKVKIIDFKKSMRGWSDKMKKDPMKRAQLQLYKAFYSKQHGLDLKNIEIEFMIFKQKIYEGGDFPSKRVQRYSPPSSEQTIKKVLKELDSFVDSVFKDDGLYNLNADYSPQPSKYNCRFCPYNNKKELCSVGKK